jgi:predicted XRE-type DNA-binding protein
VLEVVEDYDGDTYRAVYTVRFAGAVYALHAFQKKSRHGIATPAHEMDLIRTRLKQAELLHERKKKGMTMSDFDEIEYEESSGNVFADLGLPDADELLLKAGLARQITVILQERGLTQAEAARVLGTQQPKVSQLVRGALGGFSLERLIRYLNALGRDVEIVVHEQPRSHGSTSVTIAA